MRKAVRAKFLNRPILEIDKVALVRTVPMIKINPVFVARAAMPRFVTNSYGNGIIDAIYFVGRKFSFQRIPPKRCHVNTTNAASIITNGTQ